MSIYIAEKRLINPSCYREVVDIEGLTFGLLDGYASVPEGGVYHPEEIDFFIGQNDEAIEAFKTKTTFEVLDLLEKEFGMDPSDLETNYGALNLKAFNFLAALVLKDEVFEEGFKHQFREVLKLPLTNDHYFIMSYY